MAYQENIDGGVAELGHWIRYIEDNVHSSQQSYSKSAPHDDCNVNSQPTRLLKIGLTRQGNILEVREVGLESIENGFGKTPRGIHGHSVLGRL